MDAITNDKRQEDPIHNPTAVGAREPLPLPLPLSLNTMFGPCFVINLSKDHKKLDDMTKKLGKLNTSFERFDAILGKDVSDEVLSEELTGWCKLTCPKPTIGCALSHKGTWKLVVERNLPSAVVFEDDCEFDPNFYEVVGSAMKALPVDWDIVYFGCIVGCYKRKEDVPAFDSILLTAAGRNTEPEVLSEHLYRPTMPLACHAYAISNKGAKTLLEKIPKVNFHIDTHIAKNCQDMQVFAVHPNVVGQDTSGSSMASFKPALITKLVSGVKLDNRGRDLGWQMSEPVARVSDEPINGWHFLLLLFGIYSGAFMDNYYFILVMLAGYFLLEAIFEYRRNGKNGVMSSIVFLLFYMVGVGLGLGTSGASAPLRRIFHGNS
jgi:GR25 family glycosyltransferase involved in LPS biosynthesis